MEKEVIKYSVVIPMYNNQDTIERAILSIFNQTRYDLIDEIIVVNDGSTDNSKKVVEHLMNKTIGNKIILVNQKNMGAAVARNIGINKTKNSFVALLDADDEWKNNKIEVQNNILLNNQQIKALGSNRNNENVHIGKKINNKLYKISPFMYCIKNWPSTPTIIFDKTIFQNKEYFPTNMTHAEEGFFFLTLSKISGLYYVSENLVICDGGKPVFGYKGLSANIRKMHYGVIKMMKKANQKQYINKFQLFFLIIYENIKYLRRIVITSLRK